MRVNNDLVFDAGICEEVSTSHGPKRPIFPPNISLFNQVLEHLKMKPDPPNRNIIQAAIRKGEVTAALVYAMGIRISACCSIGTNRSGLKSIRRKTSRISNEEMARINIETSAALAEWINIYHQELGVSGGVKMYKGWRVKNAVESQRFSVNSRRTRTVMKRVAHGEPKKSRG